jgi:hypothetical protein
VIVRRIFAATTAVVTVAGIVTACSSVPDVSFGDGDDGEGGSFPEGGGGKPDTGRPPDGSGTGDAAKDAPGDAPGPCTPTNGGVEDCDDGLDNDCDGKTDCADDACTPTHACIGTPPIGWSLVGEADGTRPTCPAEYPTPRDIEVVTGTGAGTCACTCAPTNAGDACTLQQSTVTVSKVAACNDGADITQNVAANQAACTALGTSMVVPNGNAYGKASQPTVGAGGCTPTTQFATRPPITSGRTCAPTAVPSFGGGCGVGQVCARKATGLALCIQKNNTTEACPTTYPGRRTAGNAPSPVDAGADADASDDGGDAGSGATTVDNRTCNACSCNSVACTTTVTLYENSNCVGGGNTGALPAACTASASKNFTATAYKSTTTGTGCGVKTFDTATAGSIAFTNPTTICCP